MSLIPAICPALGIEVAVPDIDKELRLLWEKDEASTTASLMNLVVYSERPGSLLENSELIQDLTREHACRAILVEVGPASDEPSIRAWITAHCHLVDGRKSVCCEQIALYLTGRVKGRFSNTVFGHLSSDLPLVFWWQGGLSENLTERLVSVVDRLIVDSSSWENPLDGFRRVLDAARTNADMILQDHEWTRTWQFRLGVASVFDDPGAQRALPDLDAVEISYHPEHRNSALQLLAWLAVQAGWKDLEFPASPAFVSRSGVPIRLEMRENREGPALSALVLRAGDKSAHITQESATSHVERRIDAPGYRIASLAPADPVRSEQLVALQLARGGKNSLFQKILPRFLELLEKSGARP